MINILPALDEALRIGREANVPVESIHLKVGGKTNWGKMKQVISRLEEARRNGQDVTNPKEDSKGDGRSR